MGFLEESFRKRRIALGGDDILNEVIRNRESVLIKDPGYDPRTNVEFVRESKTREFVVAPILVDNNVHGLFVADNYFSARPLERVSLFANAVGLALENSRLFLHLRESEARYRTVLENSPVAVLGVSREHWITTWNRGAESIFGYQKRPLDLSLSWGGAHADFWMNNEWTVVIRDVTEAKRLQQQLIQSEKNSAVGQLIASIAHELNNPLQAVVG
jgi:two-component system NtrC family sensor kinase